MPAEFILPAELIIPPIADPIGRSWDQPDRRRFLIDDTHVLMSGQDFFNLPDYSATMPTGVYPGKMWKRHDGAFDRSFLAAGGKPEWLLVWYGADVAGRCPILSRKILLVDGAI